MSTDQEYGLGVQRDVALAALRNADETETPLKGPQRFTSPFQTAPFDILSLIFRYCAEGDWLSSLRIACVSRHWRSTVLQTPRAWCFIGGLKRSGLPLERYYETVKPCWDIYFERSTQALLHIHLPQLISLKHFAPMAHRIQCMATHLMQGMTPDEPFTRLAYLRIMADQACGASTHTSLIDPSLFPNLRHLEIYNTLNGIGLPELPPLETLAITAWLGEEWIALVDACKKTLTWLKILLEDNDDMERRSIRMPKLRYLEIAENTQQTLFDEPYTVTFRINAPALRVYNETAVCIPGSPIETADLKGVTHMCQSEIPSSFPLLNLRFLRLNVPFENCFSFLEDLAQEPHVYPRLEHIELYSQGMSPSEIASSREMLEAWDWGRIPGLTHPPSITKNDEEWSVPFPGENAVACLPGCGSEKLNTRVRPGRSSAVSVT